MNITEKRKRRKKPFSSMSITTGDIGLNIDHFNKVFGTDTDSSDSVNFSTEGAGGLAESYKLDGAKVNDNDIWLEYSNGKFIVYDLEDSAAQEVEIVFKTDSITQVKAKYPKLATLWLKKYGDEYKTFFESLTEAKRYVRRYYIRPQNRFASNKAEIIKTLIEIGDQNCTVYTLNNLGDDKDVGKLMNSDIIYYYDEGILYDKNHVRIFDYDLSIKKEEDRKKFAKVNDDSKEFKIEYKDRMTSATELEESQEILDGAFNAVLDGVFDNCNYDVISADFTPMGDKVIITLNHNVYDINEAAEELMYCLDKANITTVDWNTNGSNVFIFELAPDNEFNLDFDDVNVFGEKLNEAKEAYCSICGEPIEGEGHSTEKGIVCDGCELHFDIGG